MKKTFAVSTTHASPLGSEAVVITYIEPLDDTTNQALSRLLLSDDYCDKKECTNGEHRLWRCDDPDLIGHLDRSVGTSGLRYKVYFQIGLDGLIQPRPEQKKTSVDKLKHTITWMSHPANPLKFFKRKRHDKAQPQARQHAHA